MFHSQRQELIDLGAAFPEAIAADFALGAGADADSDRGAAQGCRSPPDKDATRRTRESRRRKRRPFPHPRPSSTSLSSAGLEAIGETGTAAQGGFDRRSDRDYPNRRKRSPLTSARSLAAKDARTFAYRGPHRMPSVRA